MASSQADTIGSSSNKAKGPDGTNGVGFRPQVNMTVEPPKQGDLQKSYASTIGDESNPK
jgi:erythrocyte band 7 integral membrane protein